MLATSFSSVVFFISSQSCLQSSNQFCGHLWTCSNCSMSFLSWGHQNCSQYSRWGVIEGSRGVESPPSSCWPHCLWCSPGSIGFPTLPAHAEFSSTITPKSFPTGLLSFFYFFFKTTILSPNKKGHMR